MKSRLFKALFDDPESDGAKGFHRHLKEFLALDDAARGQCLAAVPQLLRPRTAFQSRELVKSIADSAQADRQAVEHSLGVIRFLVKGLLSEEVPEGDHQDWAGDLANLPDIGEQGRPALQEIVAHLVDGHDEWKSQDQTLRALGGVLPRFTGMGITVEARPVKDGRYHFGTPVDEYVPQIIDLTYIASVSIGVDEGFPKDFYFQLDGTDLDDIIGSLLAAKKEIIALQEHIGER